MSAQGWCDKYEISLAGRAADTAEDVCVCSVCRASVGGEHCGQMAQKQFPSVTSVPLSCCEMTFDLLYHRVWRSLRPFQLRPGTPSKIIEGRGSGVAKRVPNLTAQSELERDFKPSQSFLRERHGPVVTCSTENHHLVILAVMTATYCVTSRGLDGLKIQHSIKWSETVLAQLTERGEMGKLWSENKLSGKRGGEEGGWHCRLFELWSFHGSWDVCRALMLSGRGGWRGGGGITSYQYW